MPFAPARVILRFCLMRASAALLGRRRRRSLPLTRASRDSRTGFGRAEAGAENVTRRTIASNGATQTFMTPTGASRARKRPLGESFGSRVDGLQSGSFLGMRGGALRPTSSMDDHRPPGANLHSMRHAFRRRVSGDVAPSARRCRPPSASPSPKSGVRYWRSRDRKCAHGSRSFDQTNAAKPIGHEGPARWRRSGNEVGIV